MSAEVTAKRRGRPPKKAAGNATATPAATAASAADLDNVIVIEAAVPKPRAKPRATKTASVKDAGVLSSPSSSTTNSGSTASTSTSKARKATIKVADDLGEAVPEVKNPKRKTAKSSSAASATADKAVAASASTITATSTPKSSPEEAVAKPARPEKTSDLELPEKTQLGATPKPRSRKASPAASEGVVEETAAPLATGRKSKTTSSTTTVGKEQQAQLEAEGLSKTAEALVENQPAAAESQAVQPSTSPSVSVSAPISKILQQAKAFAKTSSEVHDGITQLVRAREEALHASAQQGLRQQTASEEPDTGSEKPLGTSSVTGSPPQNTTSTATTISNKDLVPEDTSAATTPLSQSGLGQEAPTTAKATNFAEPEPAAQPISKDHHLPGSTTSSSPIPAFETIAPISPSPPHSDPSPASHLQGGAFTMNPLPTTHMALPTGHTSPLFGSGKSRSPPAAIVVPKYGLPASTVAALAARNVHSQRPSGSSSSAQGPSLPPSSTRKTPQQQAPAYGHGPGTGEDPGRPRPTQIPLDQLKKDPQFRALSRRWTSLMVALPFAIVTSYYLWQRCEYFPPVCLFSVCIASFHVLFHTCVRDGSAW